MYLERYVSSETSDEALARDARERLKGLIDVALEISDLKRFLGREKPTAITVSAFPFSPEKWIVRTWASVIGNADGTGERRGNPRESAKYDGLVCKADQSHVPDRNLVGGLLREMRAT
jgi:hypothetical protein